MNNPAPIILFVYNRPWHTRQTIEALQKNELAPESELFIFSDGPRSAADTKNIQAVRTYCKTITGFKRVHITERDKNWGLARSIIAGVTEVVNAHGRVIVLEDDLVTSPYFLRFINDGLNVYEHDQSVASIQGYIYPMRDILPQTFFIKGADCQGWATWKRAWDLFESNGQKLVTELQQRNLVEEFDFGGAYDYIGLLKKQAGGGNDSWAIRWYASAFLHNMFTLYPGRSLISNIGWDGSGRNSGVTDKFNPVVSSQPIIVTKIPREEIPAVREEVVRFFHSLRPSLGTRIMRKIRRTIKNVLK